MATVEDPRQELTLPPEVTALGRPLQVHRGSAVTTNALLVLILGAVLLAGGVAATIIYFKVPFKKNDKVPKETMLYIAGGLGGLGAAICVGAWSAGAFKAGGHKPSYLIYHQALVLLQDDAATVIHWSDITALISPKHLGPYHVATADGRKLPISRDVDNYSGLIEAVATRVTEQVVGPAKRALDEGETVNFGPFGVSSEALYYKGKTLPWDKVAVVELQIGRAGRRLRVRASGSLLPWCYADIDSFPNGTLFPEVLRHVCPPRLLARA